MPKFKVGDKVKIIGNSCGLNINNQICCENYKKEFPYMIVERFDGEKIKIQTPKHKLASHGCTGCSAYMEKDLQLFNPTMKELLE
jgi:hypothetical protein